MSQWTVIQFPGHICCGWSCNSVNPALLSPPGMPEIPRKNYSGFVRGHFSCTHSEAPSRKTKRTSFVDVISCSSEFWCNSHVELSPKSLLMRVFLPTGSQQLLGDYGTACYCKESHCVHSLIKYSSKDCHRLKEPQKCLVSSMVFATSRARVTTGQLLCSHGSSSKAGGVHREATAAGKQEHEPTRSDVSLSNNFSPDPRAFLGLPGARRMETPEEMGTRVTTVITGFGVKKGRRRIGKHTDDEIVSLAYFCSAPRAYTVES